MTSLRNPWAVLMWVVALMAFVIMLGGCASGPYKALDASKQAKVTASEGIVGVKQEELNVGIDPAIMPIAVAGTTFASGFVAGAVSALVITGIENTELKRSEKAEGPLRNALLDFDFDGLALRAVQVEVAKVGWLHLDKVTLTKDVSSDDYDKILDGAQAPYTLFVNEGYFLTTDLKQLYVVAQIVLLPKPAPGSTIRRGPNGTTYFMPPSDVSNAVYTNVVYYKTAIPQDAYEQFEAQTEASPPPVPPHAYVDLDRVAAVRYWSQDDASPMKRALTDAASELGRLVAQCLQNPGKLASFKDEVAVGIRQGRVVGQEDDARTVVQFDDGSLMSVDTRFVKTLYTGKQ